MEKGNSALLQMLFVNNVDLNALDKHSQTRVADFLTHKETTLAQATAHPAPQGAVEELFGRRLRLS